MSYTTWKIEHTPYDNGWDDIDKVELTSFHSPLLRVTIGDTRDSVNFKVTNFNGIYDNVFSPNDKLTIYRTSNTDIVTTDDILMVASIKDTPETETGSTISLGLEGYNFSETIMDAIVFVDTPNKNIPEFIQEALNNAGEKNPNFKVNWNSGNNAAIASLTFPTVVESRFFNKPLRNIIEKYSSAQETNNGDFYWYVDNNNTLVWRPKQSQSSDTFNYSTDSFIKYKDAKDVKGVKNFIILKSDNDPAGNPIQIKYVNWSSVASHGVKYYFLVSDKNSSKNLVEKDLKKSYGTEIPNVSFPSEIAAGTSFTTAWKSNYNYTTKNYSIVVTKNNNVTINEGNATDNEKAYTEVIREEIKNRLNDEGKEFADAHKFGKLTVEITFKAGKKSWSLGNIIDCTIPKINSTIKKMRVIDIQYSATTDTFTLQEDEGTL